MSRQPMTSNAVGESGCTFLGDLNATFPRANLWSHWVVSFVWPRREGSLERHRAHFQRPAWPGYSWFPLAEDGDEPVVPVR